MKLVAKLAVLFATTSLLASCGTYQLGHVSPQTGKTKEQQQLDVLLCKDEARNAVNSPGQQAGRFVAGMTLVGIPVAYEAEKSQGRATFTSCMQGRGIRLLQRTTNTATHMHA